MFIRRAIVSDALCRGTGSHPRRRKLYHTTSTKLSNNDDNSLATNGGTIQAAFIFHRHGDRAPNRYLGAPSYLQNEAEHWYGRIPPPSGGVNSVHDNLCRYFPPDIHPSQNDGRYMDISREPFGFLTYRGMDQMREVGKRFRRRYERFGHHVAGSHINNIEEQYSFLDHWDVQAYSTNYLRTVMSVQSFLDGLIGSCPSKRTTNNNNQTQPLFVGGGLKRYYKDMGKFERLSHMDLSTWTTDEDMDGRVENGTVHVQVRDKEIDTLNAFDRHPQMMNGLVKDVIATERFQRIDGNAKALAETLSTYLPGLHGAPQAFGGTPSGINWIHANDFFVCRRAHSIPLRAFSDYEGKKNEHEVEKALALLATPVCAHLAWRFREWYRNQKLVAAVACPPFKEILKIMLETTTNAAANTETKKRPFVIYSCHDVTLLALLYAIGADFLVSGEDCGGSNMSEGGVGGMANMGTGNVSNGEQKLSWRWWPAYSSTIAFELVKIDNDAARGSGDDEYIIRVILNGEPLRLIPRMRVDDEGILNEQPLSSRQVFGGLNIDDRNINNMMKLADFEQVIRILEEDGSSNFTSVEEEKSSIGMRQMDKIGVDGG